MPLLTFVASGIGRVKSASSKYCSRIPAVEPDVTELSVKSVNALHKTGTWLMFKMGAGKTFKANVLVITFLHPPNSNA